MNKGVIKVLYFIAILILGLLVFVVFSHIRPMLQGNIDWIGRICLITGLFLSALIIKKNENLKNHWMLLFAFGIAATAMAIDLYLPSTSWWLFIFQVSIDTPLGIAIDKLDSSILIIFSILILNKVSGGTLENLFLLKGNVCKSLKIGIIAFVICVSGAYFVAQMFGAQNLSLSRVIPWIPFILIFIIGNALNEEIMFRGLFLRKMEPFLGRLLTNLVIAIPFVLHHTGVTYTQNALMFLLFLLPLSLAWGFIAQKTDSIWGSFLFHAGTDIPVIIAIFAVLI